MNSTLINRLARVPHAFWIMLMQGAATTAVGLCFWHAGLMVIGITAILTAAVLLVLVRLAGPQEQDAVLMGEIIEQEQQPQLPDVRAHASHTKILAKVP